MLAEMPPPPPRDLALGSDHPVFRRVAAGGHADLMVLEPGMIHPETKKETAEIVVDHVRGAIGFLGMTPAEGGWRVLVVDHAEEMNASAENALLKILEEPHARSLLLLVSHAPGRLLRHQKAAEGRNLDGAPDLVRHQVDQQPDDDQWRAKQDAEEEHVALAAVADEAVGAGWHELCQKPDRHCDHRLGDDEKPVEGAHQEMDDHHERHQANQHEGGGEQDCR